jgi:alpha-glucosidase
MVGRDPERTPMQWDTGPNAGFMAGAAPEDVIPWLPVASDYATCNVAVAEQDPGSMLSFFRALTHLRRAEPALSVGSYASVETDHADVFAYLRTAPQGQAFLVVLNFGTETRAVDLSGVAAEAVIAVATDMVRAGTASLQPLTLHPNEGLVLRLGDRP